MIEERLYVYGKPLEECDLETLKEAVRAAHRLIKEYDDRVSVLKAQLVESKTKIANLRRQLNRKESDC